MSDTQGQAQHTRGRHARVESKETPTRPDDAKPKHAKGRHRGYDRTHEAGGAPGETGLIPVIGSHVGVDRTAAPNGKRPTASAKAAALSGKTSTVTADVSRPASRARHAIEPSAPATAEGIAVGTASEGIAVGTASDAESENEERTPEVGASAALISICTIISRITGFARTWAMAFALGATFVSSSYQVANNLPNMLYELVMGGMLTTAFLPVYLSVKKRLGKKQSQEYASNLLTIVVLGLGVIALLCILFPAQVIYTQTFYSDQSTMDLSVFFFRFFAIQIVFYGAAAIVSGLLNANRDYLWGAIAPVFNNIIVIVTFLMYAFIAPHDQQLAFYVIAIGNPLGVFVQMSIQIPALKRNDIRLRPHINLHDPALRETVQIGIPALLVTICSFVTVSVTNAASYCFADNGPSVIAYSRLWFTFPYSFLAVPVATAMFTELSDMQADNNRAGVIRGIISGTNQIFFLMIPFAMYLIVYSVPLVTLYHMGAFSSDNITQIASYLAVMAIALPFYGVNTYLQMAFSSIRKMRAFSVVTLIASALQVGVVAAAAWGVQNGAPISIESIAGGTIVAYVVGDVLAFIYLRRYFGPMGFSSTVLSCLRALGLGLAGAAAGGGVLFALETLVAPLNGSIAQAFVYIVAGGLVSLIVTFGPAIKLKLPEAAFVISAVNKVAGKLKRS